MSRFFHLRKVIRIGYLLIALVLFAQTAFAIHNGMHGIAQQDHCSIAQLLQTLPCSIPSDAPALLPHNPPIQLFLASPSLINPTLYRLFQIRAPPVFSV